MSRCFPGGFSRYDGDFYTLGGAAAFLIRAGFGISNPGESGEGAPVVLAGTAAMVEAASVLWMKVAKTASSTAVRLGFDLPR
jgi:hypothetical protein